MKQWVVGCLVILGCQIALSAEIVWKTPFSVGSLTDFQSFSELICLRDLDRELGKDISSSLLKAILKKNSIENLSSERMSELLTQVQSFNVGVQPSTQSLIIYRKSKVGQGFNTFVIASMPAEMEMLQALNAMSQQQSEKARLSQSQAVVTASSEVFSGADSGRGDISQTLSEYVGGLKVYSQLQSPETGFMTKPKNAIQRSFGAEKQMGEDQSMYVEVSRFDSTVLDYRQSSGEMATVGLKKSFNDHVSANVSVSRSENSWGQEDMVIMATLRIHPKNGK